MFMGLSTFSPYVLALLLAAYGFACSNSKPEPTGGGETKKPGEKSDDDKDDGKDGGKEDGEDGSTGGKGDSLGGSAQGENGGDVEEDGESSSDPKAGCGAGDFSQTIQSANIRFQGVAGKVFSTEYNVVVKGSIAFQGGADGLTTTSRFDIISSDPDNAADKASDEIQKVTGSRASTPAAATEDMPCGVYPVTKIVEQTGAHATTTNFSPALPYFLSPLMSKTRFNKDFPSAKTFSGLSVSVASTSNELIKSGQTASGSVTITPVSPETSFQDTEGRTVTVQAEYAYKIEFNFGNHETVNSFGLYKVATYYVKGGKFHVITVETGVEDAPVINYIGN
jgi:hypothetical protein